MTKRICYYLGTYEDWGGASRALLNFVVRIDRAQFEPLVVVTQQGRLLARLAECGVATAICPKRDWNGNPFKFAADVVRSIAFLRRHGIDFIHMNGGALGWKPPELIAAKLLRIPVLMHYHIAAAHVTPFVRYAQSIVAVSRYVAEHSPFGSYPPVSVVHNIADVARFAYGHSIREELGLKDDDVVITFLGQVKRLKGVDMFLRLAAAIDRPNVKFVVAGEVKDTDASFVNRFESAVAENPRLHYIGFRTDAENLYASTDILIMPSLVEEACAMVLFESASARKPVVASRTGGTPEILRDGVNGLLFDRDDFDTLLRNTLRLIDDPAERAAFGQRAYEVVERDFTLQPVRELERVYREMLEGPDDPAAHKLRESKLSGVPK